MFNRMPSRVDLVYLDRYVLAEAQAGNMITAIRNLRDYAKHDMNVEVGLKEAKDWVEENPNDVLDTATDRFKAYIKSIENRNALHNAVHILRSLDCLNLAASVEDAIEKHYKQP